MNQLVEMFSYFSLALSYCEYMGNSISSISSKYGVDARTAIPYVIIGCLCLWIFVSKRRPRSKSMKIPESRARYIGEIHGGNLVLQRLEEFNKAQVNPATLANSENLLKALLEEEHLDLIKLQQTVSKLEMSGSEDSAVKILKQATDKARSGTNWKPHEAYEIEMLLVEMQIYKANSLYLPGDLEKSLDYECLKDESIKDKRRPLYKAIIYKMLRKTEKAKECWEKFIEVRDPPLNANSHTDFQWFAELVDRLQSAISENYGNK